MILLDEVVEKNDKLVRSIVHKYSYSPSDFDDLYQVGIIGLMKASENYREGFNTKFSTYAHTYILGEVLKYIRENKVIKISNETVKLSKSIAKARDILTQRLMRVPSNFELACFLEMEESQIEEVETAVDYVRSLDYELNDEGKELTLYNQVSYEEQGYNEDILDLREEIKNLSPQEQALIHSRYYEGKSQQETSKVIGMSQVQVSRNETKILTKLKDRLAS